MKTTWEGFQPPLGYVSVKYRQVVRNTKWTSHNERETYWTKMQMYSSCALSLVFIQRHQVEELWYTDCCFNYL